MKKGLFIAIYGVNNIGKSTHAKLLVERMKKAGYPVVYLKYPLYELEPTGPQLNGILRAGKTQTISEYELQKLFAANRMAFQPQLTKMLQEGTIIVAEDYTGTGFAWGMAKGLTRDVMENLNKDLIKEDFAILLIGKRDIRAKEKHHIHEENDQLIQNVSKIFIQLAGEYNWTKVEIQPSIETTAKLVWNAVEGFLKGNNNVEI